MKIITKLDTYVSNRKTIIKTDIMMILNLFLFNKYKTKNNR